VAGGRAASTAPASGAFVDLSFDVKNLQGSLSVRFNPADIVSDDGGIAMARSGAMDAVYLGGLVFLLGVSGRTARRSGDEHAQSRQCGDHRGRHGPAGATVTC
jgi:hypothetical protein